MFNGILDLHNLVRWLVLVAGVYAIFKAIGGLTGNKTWEKSDKIAGSIFAGMIDLQLLIGFGLYFMSPIVKSALANMSAAMKDPTQRQFAVEHISIMIIAAVLAHVGSIMVKRASSDTAKFRMAAIFYSLAILTILYGIPWSRSLIPGIH